MDWTEILSTAPNELSADTLDFIKNNISTVDASALNVQQLRKFFELSCFIIQRFTDDAKNAEEKELLLERKKTVDNDESYYIQTIQELNREIAEYVYNKKAESGAGVTDTDPVQSIANETKKDLLYKIHVKNKYIKRLLSENDLLKEKIDHQNEKILLLNVSLKQTAHKLNKAIGDLTEQKQQNHMTVDDIADLHAKINSVREQMTRIELDKQKYKHDVLYLGDEIQKKINQWNEVLKKKYNHFQCDDNDVKSNEMPRTDFKEETILGQYDENRFEVNVLSQAINKRNLIITEMEQLLIDLTMEISQSAIVINRIIKNLSQRETNFATNLDKLRKHLAKLLDRPNEHDPKTTNASRSKRKNGRSNGDVK